MNKRTLTLLTTFITAALTLTALFFGFPSPEPLCTLPKANAQDNPCIVQDATISAMQLALVQSTLDSLNYQATISALQTQVVSQPGGGTTAEGVSSLPFREDFNNNDRGWDVTARSDGVAEIKSGHLLIRDTVESPFVVLIPDLLLPDNFYFEAKMKVIDVSWFGVGLWLGNDNTNQYHTFFVGYDGIDQGVKVLDGLSTIRETSLDLISTFTPGTDNTLALEVSDGIYSLYINGEVVVSESLQPYGPQIGILVDYGNALEIDYIVVREKR
jgi:hypothetical protein